MSFDTGLDRVLPESRRLPGLLPVGHAVPGPNDDIGDDLGLLPDCEITTTDRSVYVPPVPPCVEDRNADGSFVSPDVPGAGRRPEGPRLTA